MLELGTLNIEDKADVPQFIHPILPNEDLESLGVPYLDKNDDGLSVLKTPIFEDNGSGKPVTEPPATTNEEIPICSTYFYHRWMWIQFPWVAISNCGDNFEKGIEYTKSLKKDHYKKIESNKVANRCIYTMNV